MLNRLSYPITPYLSFLKSSWSKEKSQAIAVDLDGESNTHFSISTVVYLSPSQKKGGWEEVVQKYTYFTYYKLSYNSKVFISKFQKSELLYFQEWKHSSGSFWKQTSFIFIFSFIFCPSL